MSYQKPNPEIDEKLENWIVAQRGAIRRTEDISALSQHPGWNAILADLRERLVELDFSLSNFEKMTAEERTLALKERKDFRLLSTLVESAEERLPEMFVALKQAEQQLNERKNRNGIAR